MNRTSSTLTDPLDISIATTASKRRKTKAITYPNSKVTSTHKAAETVLIVNPNSCSGLTGKNWDQLFDQIKKVLGKDTIKVAFSKKPGDGTRLARDYLRRGFTEIFAVGGDGTIMKSQTAFLKRILELATVQEKQVCPD